MTKGAQFPEITGGSWGFPHFRRHTKAGCFFREMSHNTVQVGGGVGGTDRRGDRIGFHRYFPF